MLNVLFIEADNQKSLGGSCLRDIRNLNDYLSKDGFDSSKRRQTLFLSIDNNNKLSNVSNVSNVSNICYDFLRNYQSRFQEFVDNTKNGDNVLICISGHGYQQFNKEEKDSMDEYISFGNGIIKDGVLYSLLIEKLKEKCNRVVCLIDTCQSYTMFAL